MHQADRESAGESALPLAAVILQEAVIHPLAPRYTGWSMKRLILLAAALLLLPGCTVNMLAAAVLSVDSEREQQRPAELDPFRTVRDQDCTRPIENTGGNLRCQ